MKDPESSFWWVFILVIGGVFVLNAFWVAVRQPDRSDKRPEKKSESVSGLSRHDGLAVGSPVISLSAKHWDVAPSNRWSATNVRLRINAEIDRRWWSNGVLYLEFKAKSP